MIYNTGLSALFHYSQVESTKWILHTPEVKVIYLATMTTIITWFIANMDTPIKKSNIIYLSLILL